MLFDDEDLPWTVRLSLGWTLLLSLFSFGLLFLALGLYLSYWIRSRFGRGHAFWSYCAVSVIALILLVLPLAPLRIGNLFIEAIATFGSVLWVVSALVLRSEILSIYKDDIGVAVTINVWLTIFFTSIYLNYCLSAPGLESRFTTRKSRGGPPGRQETKSFGG